MGAKAQPTRSFENVGEGLYRYIHRDLLRTDPNQLQGGRRSWETKDRATAKRKLADLHRKLARTDADAARVTLANLCDQYLLAVQNQKEQTLRASGGSPDDQRGFPGGADVPAGKILPSQISAWLASYKFGVASYNLYLEFIRAAFALALADRAITDSPVTSLKTKAREKPIRRTPTFEDFRAIVADIRNQQWNADARDSGDFVEFIGLAGLGQAEAASRLGRISTWQIIKSRLFATRPAEVLWCQSIHSFDRFSTRFSKIAAVIHLEATECSVSRMLGKP